MRWDEKSPGFDVGNRLMRISEPERKAEQRSEEATGTPTSRYIANAPIKYLDQTPVDYRGRAHLGRRCCK